MPIVLKSLNIQVRERYEPMPGTYHGDATFDSEFGRIKINLDARLSAEVLKICADSMTRATQELANNMTAQVLEQAGKALEHTADSTGVSNV